MLLGEKTFQHDEEVSVIVSSSIAARPEISQEIHHSDVPPSFTG